MAPMPPSARNSSTTYRVRPDSRTAGFTPPTYQMRRACCDAAIQRERERERPQTPASSSAAATTAGPRPASTTATGLAVAHAHAHGSASAAGGRGPDLCRLHPHQPLAVTDADRG